MPSCIVVKGFRCRAYGLMQSHGAASLIANALAMRETRPFLGCCPFEAGTSWPDPYRCAVPLQAVMRGVQRDGSHTEPYCRIYRYRYVGDGGRRATGGQAKTKLWPGQPPFLPPYCTPPPPPPLLHINFPLPCPTLLHRGSFSFDSILRTLLASTVALLHQS